MAKTRNDPESIGISKLRSRGLVVFEKAKPRLLESANIPFINHGVVAMIFNPVLQGMLLELAFSVSFEHLCVRIGSSSKSVIALIVWLVVV